MADLSRALQTDPLADLYARGMRRDVKPEDATQAVFLEKERQRLEAAKSEAERKRDVERTALEGARERQAGERSKRESEIEALKSEPGPVSDVKYPKFRPPEQSAGDLFAALLTAAFMGTAGGKKNYMLAASSLTGALEGYKKGQQDVYNRELKNFEMAFKNAQTEEREFQQKANKILADRQKSIAEKHRQLGLLAKEYGAQNAIAAARVNNYEALVKSTTSNLDASVKKLDTLVAEVNRDVREAKQEAARKAESRTAKEGEVLVRKPDGTLTKIKEVYKDGELVIPPGYKLVEKGDKGEADDRTKPTTVDTRAYQALKKEQKLWGRMSETLSNPEFAKRFDSLGLKKFLFEPLVTNEGILNVVSKAMSAAQSKAIAENDKEMINFLQDITQVRNTYYLE